MITLQMEDIIIIPNRIRKNAPEDLAEESRHRSLTTQNWGAKGGFSLHLLPHPLQPPPMPSVRSRCSKCWGDWRQVAQGCRSPCAKQHSCTFTGQQLLHPESASP